MIKSFRGNIASGDIDTIRLSTNNGLTGYKVLKFRLMGVDPTVNEDEAVAKVFTVKPAAATATVNLDDPTILAVGVYTGRATTRSFPINEVIIFDHVIVNQDLFLSCVETVTTNNINYYLELEQVKLAVDEAAVATLKDMRGTE